MAIFFLLKYIMLKRILTSPWTALFALAIVLAIRIADPAFVESVRLRYFDTLVTSKSAEVTGIHVVNIDERTLEQYGQFPFSRDRYADIIRDLYARGAGLVVFNILTPDRDRMGRDTAYVATLQKYPTVLPSVGATQGRNEPRQPGSAVIGPFSLDVFVTYPGIIANIPTVESAAAGVGITNTLPEIDGVVRRMPMVVAVDNKLYPSLAIEVMRVAAGDSTFQVKINELGVEKMRIPAFGPVATDSLSRIWIDWSLQPERHSLTNLPANFDGEIVIVGVSAAGLANPVATSLGEMLPQDLQAAVIGTVIANRDRPAIARPDWADGAEIIALMLLSVGLIFLSRWTYVGIISSVVVLGVCVPISRIVYSSHAWLIDSTLVIGGLGVVLLYAYGVKFVSEFLQKQQIKKQFGSYVNPTIVERLQQHPELIKLGGEKKLLSVVMTDMRNFTALGESYGEAGVEDFTRVMNSYMTALSVPILKNDGTLIKFIGDASLHIHGAPIDDEDHAYHAVQTALEMIQAVKEFNNELASLGKPPVGMGAGVNTGEIVVGNIGAKTKFGYDVLGDPVSLAARLESQSKGYGVLMIISENTARLVEGRVPLWELDNIAVKGKTEPVRIFAIEQPTELHEEFLHKYYAGNWTQALRLIDGCKKAAPQMEHYYDAMATRLQTGVPNNWNGYYVATAK
jgi:adenylate cyclase